MPLKLLETVSDSDKHEYDVTSLVFKDNNVYSSADDGKIKMWSADLKFEKEVQAHPCSIYSMTTDYDKLIYSCSSDGSVRSWKTGSLDPDAIILHPGPQEMWKIWWAEGSLCVVDDVGMIDIYEGKELVRRVEMLEQIKDIALQDNLLYSVRDLDLVITQLLEGEYKRYTCRKTLPGRAPLFLVSDYLCYSSRDGKEVIINNRNSDSFSEVARIENAHEMMLLAIGGFKRYSGCLLFTGGWDKILKQWRLVDGKVTPDGSCQIDDYINTICVDDKAGIVYCGGEGGKIWKFDSK